MSGTPMLAIFDVDVANNDVKQFGKRVAEVARTRGGAKYLTYVPIHVPGRSAKGPTKDVVYVWFPDGPESATSLQGNKSTDDAAELIALAKAAKGGYRAFGKSRLHRVAEHGRQAGAPPPYLAVLGVEVNPDPAKVQSLKAGLKLVHQAAISRNKAVRYAAHKLGDKKHGVLIYGMDSPDGIKQGIQGGGPLEDGKAALSQSLEASLKTQFKPDTFKKVHLNQTLKYLHEYSNP